MQNYHVKLESEVFDSFRCQKAADSLDIDSKKKSVHELKISIDLKSEFNICLVVGASGSGKTTLAKHIFGPDIFKERLDLTKPIIEQFPKEWTYDECARALCGIGLTSVPCWIRPAYTLSNGQRARAEAALQLSLDSDYIVLDEWTSVVDRTVGKVMSHCIQKFVRSTKRKIILLSCHYDVIEWLDPDIVIDCNDQKVIDRRLLSPDERKRKELLTFDIRPVSRSTWKTFSKYHYLSERLPGGVIKCFGLFHGENQIAFQCFANYTPRKKSNEKLSMHSNRTVIHPDYAGFGLGIKIINETSEIMLNDGFKVYAKFSSIPVFKSFQKSELWRLLKIERNIGNKKNIRMHKYVESMRKNVTTFSYIYLGKEAAQKP